MRCLIQSHQSYTISMVTKHVEKFNFRKPLNTIKNLLRTERWKNICCEKKNVNISLLTGSIAYGTNMMNSMYQTIHSRSAKPTQSPTKPALKSLIGNDKRVKEIKLIGFIKGFNKLNCRINSFFNRTMYTHTIHIMYVVICFDVIVVHRLIS